MKKPDLIKQLANRINQPHVIESWINKIEKASYNKCLKDAESKQCNIHSVSQQRELLIAYEKTHYTPQEWALASEQCIEDIDNFLAINCG